MSGAKTGARVPISPDQARDLRLALLVGALGVTVPGARGRELRRALAALPAHRWSRLGFCGRCGVSRPAHDRREVLSACTGVVGVWLPDLSEIRRSGR